MTYATQRGIKSPNDTPQITWQLHSYAKSKNERKTKHPGSTLVCKNTKQTPLETTSKYTRTQKTLSGNYPRTPPPPKTPPDPPINYTLKTNNVSVIFGWCSDDVWVMFLWYFRCCSDDVWIMFGWCLDDVWMMFGWCLGDVGMMFGWCLDDA